MAQLTKAQFFTKWVPLLADNEFQNIDGPRFAEYLADLRDSAVWADAPNVPLYDPAEVYPVGRTVRAGQPETFYYSLQAGLLPAPTGLEDDAHWRLVPGPVALTVLYQALCLPQARGLAAGAAPDDAGQLVGPRPAPGRLYGIALAAGGQGQARTYYVWGLAGRFDGEGTLVEGSTCTKGTLDLATGTFTPRASGGGTGASSFSELAGQPSDNPALAAALAGKASLVDGKVPLSQLPGIVRFAPYFPPGGSTTRNLPIVLEDQPGSYAVVYSEHVDSYTVYKVDMLGQVTQVALGSTIFTQGDTIRLQASVPAGTLPGKLILQKL